MPIMDGLEATARIRKQEGADNLPRTPIIALTANVTDEDRERCLAAGMDGFVGKPIDFKALLETLMEWSRPISAG